MTRVLIRPLPSRPGLRVVGEIDVTNRPEWMRAFDLLAGVDVDVSLDLEGLVFIDVGGVALMVTAAQRLTGGRKMILRRPPPPLVRTLDLMFPEIPALEVTNR